MADGISVEVSLVLCWSIYFQLALTGIFGALVGVLGGDPGYDFLYLALTLLMLVEIATVSWVIFHRR